MGCRENLANVPGAVDRGDGAGARLRSDEWSVGERDDVFAGGGAVADEALGDQDAVVLADTEDALVEKLVVQRAQAQSVVDVVRFVPGRFHGQPACSTQTVASHSAGPARAEPAERSVNAA